MNDEMLDQDLDELFARHVRSRLDGQLGRAERAFREELDAKRRWRTWAAAAVAIAACVVMAGGVLWHSPKPTQTNGDMIASTQTGDEPFTPIVQSATWSRMVDNGSAVIDDQPVRQMSRKVVEEIEWFDPKDGATVRTTLPRQQIFLIGMEAD